MDIQAVHIFFKNQHFKTCDVLILKIKKKKKTQSICQLNVKKKKDLSDKISLL